jgi:hypothetical protein
VIQIRTVPDFRSYTIGFLNQRARAYRICGNYEKVAAAETLRGRLNLIKDWNFWRHCLEIKNNETLLLSVLPSHSGQHAEIRERMLVFVDQCKKIASNTSKDHPLTATGRNEGRCRATA